jgi:hypothetical protein
MKVRGLNGNARVNIAVHTLWDFLIHLRARDQYSKTEATYAQYRCLFIYLLFIFSPTCFGKATMPLSRGLYQIT